MALPVQTRVLNALGYSMVYIRNNQNAFPSNITVDELAYITDLVTKVEAIDTELLENTRDSMAVKVQDLGLDYNRYILQTLALQQRLLEKLSDVTGITPNTESTASEAGTIAVRNYY